MNRSDNTIYISTKLKMYENIERKKNQFYNDIVISKMYSNEAFLFFRNTGKAHDYSLPCAKAVICGRFNITVN